ncbi:unnamed protein product, partial [Rotaria magnacalcarata]
LYESKEQIRNTFKESLITAVRNGLFDCNNIRIDLCFRDWFIIKLKLMGFETFESKAPVELILYG